MGEGAGVRGISAAFSVLLALFGAAYLHAQTPAALTLTPMRQVDKNGPFTATNVVRSADHAVWVKFGWETPLAAETKFDVQWFDPKGNVLLKDSATVKAGAKEHFAGIYIANKPIANNPGKYSVRVFAAGDMKPMAQAEFSLETSVSDPKKPAFTAALGQSVNAGAEAVAATRTFFSDNKAVWIALAAKEKIAPGHKLVAKVFDANGALALFGNPLEYKEGADRLATGFYIAGKDWAKAGGSFTFKVFWDDDPAPIAEIPFKINTANRYAVLVGIKDYPPAGPENDLAGCDRDLETMKILLQDTYGIPADHIQIVADLNATKANIEKALTELADKAGPNDGVIFYYSGHGAQVPDLDGDEEDGWDEALVPAEVIPALVTTETDLNRFITDDRIAELLRRFKTQNVTVMFDSCHSGTAVRAADDVEPPSELGETKFRHFDFGRNLLRKAREARQARSEQSQKRAGEDVAFRGVSTKLVGFEEKAAGDDSVGVGSRFVFVASSRPWETSGCNVYGGFFTSNLANALRLSDGKSWEQLIPAVREGVALSRPGQIPGVEGAVKRMPFSIEEAATDAPYSRPFVSIVGAMKAGETKAEQIEEGTAGSHRALVEGYQSLYVEQVGALYDVYPKGDAAFSGKPVGRVRITGDRENVVIAKPSNRPPVERMYSTADILSGTVHRGDRLIPVAVPVPAEKPKVGLMVSSQAMGAEKDRLLGVARAILGELKRVGNMEFPESFKFSEVDYVVEPRLMNGQMTAFVWSSGGWKMANFGGSENEVAAKVAGFIGSRHRQNTRLVRLSNPSPSFRFFADAEGGDRMFRPGETVTIRAEAGEVCYLTVLMATPGQGSVVSVTNEEVKPGSPTYVKVTLPGDANGYVPVKIIATKERLDTKGVEQAPGEKRADALAQALQQKVGSGGNGARFVATEGWAEATVRLSVGK